MHIHMYVNNVIIYSAYKNVCWGCRSTRYSLDKRSLH